ncbi:hypothetical protein ABK040_013121 [Willaertia magna]
MDDEDIFYESQASAMEEDNSRNRRLISDEDEDIEEEYGTKQDDVEESRESSTITSASSYIPNELKQVREIHHINQIKQIVSFNQFDLLDAKGGLDFVVVNGDQLIVHFLKASYLNPLNSSSSINHNNDNNDNKKKIISDEVHIIPYYLDWNEHGGQYLHLIYLIEMFIKNMLDRDMLFDIVFFENDFNISTSFLLRFAFECWSNQQEDDNKRDFNWFANCCLLAKQVVKQHLIDLCKFQKEKNRNDQFHLNVVTISDWFQNNDWLIYLQRKKPSFIIGTLSPTIIKTEIFSIDDLFATDLILICNFPFVYHVQFFGNTVIGFCSGIRENMNFVKQDVKEFLFENIVGKKNDVMEQVCLSFIERHQLLRNKEDDNNLKSDLDDLLLLYDGDGIDRLQLVIISIIKMLKTNSDKLITFWKLSIVLLTTSLLQTILPIEYRAQIVNNMTNAKELSFFIQEICGSALSTILTANNEVYHNIHDLFDFRLYVKLLTIFYNSNSLKDDKERINGLLPNSIQSTFNEIIEFIEKQVVSLTTIDDHQTLSEWWETEIKPLIDNSGNNTEITPTCLINLEKINNPIIQEIIKDINCKLPEPTKEQLKQQEGDDNEWNNSFSNASIDINWSDKKDLGSLHSFAPKNQYEKLKVQETQRRLHHYSESIKSLSEKKVIESAKVEATDTSTKAPSSKVRLMMIDSNIKKRDKEYNELKEKFMMYGQKFVDEGKDLDRVRENTERLEGFETIIRALLEGTLKDIRVIQAVQVTASSKDNTTQNAANQLVEQRTNLEHIYIMFMGLRLDYLSHLILERKKSEVVHDAYYWDAFETSNKIYEISCQFISDEYLKEVELKGTDKAGGGKSSGGKKKGEEKKKKKSKIDIVQITQNIVNVLCDLGFVDYAKKFIEGHEGIKIKKGAKNDKPSSAEYQLIYSSAIIESSQIEVPPPEVEESATDKKKKPATVVRKNKKGGKDEKEEKEEEKPTTGSSSDVLSKMYKLSFTPDPWQYDMIKSIIQNRSVLCSAPTSSGKTFIAFYAIEKILRESDDAVIVYCSPTKALVNQCYAEVYSRFHKVYSSNMTMLGMYTSEEKINVTNCQVLITIPQCLELLMTSTENLEWKKRMKYIILDEIHCINESSATGSVWEHILSLVECPFIALSATIGNPSQFGSWLDENKGNVDLVVYDERPRPLEYFNYNTANDKLTEIHPMATLNVDAIDTNALSNIQNFSPHQCLSLFQTAEQVSQDLKIPNLLESLDPSVYFPAIGIIKRTQFTTYGKLMKEELIKLSKDSANHPFLIEIIRRLSSEVTKSYDMILQQEDPQKKYGSDAWLKENFVPLCMKLSRDRLLPSIVFNFDRNMCDSLLNRLSTHLSEVREKGTTLYATSTEKIKSEKEIRYSIQSLEPFNIPEELIEGLEVGVAVHHHGCPSEYLTEVERLFRSRCLPIVISTSTLSLGIHMPARTVIIAGHSIYLTTTMFAQICGRSGRRGLENKGRAILFGIPQVIMNRLMSGTTPKIKGAMGLKSSFILKMLALLNSTKNLPLALQNIVKEDISRLINKQIFYLGNGIPESENQNKMSFRFVLEFLRRNHYLNDKIEPLDFSMLNQMLFYYEPSNFIFLHLLKSGTLHQFLTEFRSQLEKEYLNKPTTSDVNIDDDITERLLTIMNVLFEPRKLSHWDISPFKLEDPIPELIKKQLKNYNRQVLRIFSTFVITYCKNYPKQTDDTKLPLSKIEVPTLNNHKTLSLNNNELYKLLEQSRIKYNGTSSFAAISGNGDNYENVLHLLRTHKHTVVLDESLLPYLSIIENICEGNFSFGLSSFALEFLKGGNIRRLVVDCDFPTQSQALNTIRSLDRVLGQTFNYIFMVMNIKGEGDIFIRYLRMLRDRFHDRVTGGRKTRKKFKYLKNINLEIDDRDAIKGSSGKIRNKTKQTRKEGISKDEGALM